MTDQERAIGRLEGKVDMVIDLLRDHCEKNHSHECKHEEAIATLIKDKYQRKGMVTLGRLLYIAVGAALVAAWEIVKTFYFSRGGT